MGDEQEKSSEIPSAFKRMIRMESLPWLRKAIVAVVGFTVLLIGVAMVVLPGPAIVVIPLGLAILATEFIWAQRLLNRAREMVKKKMARARRKPNLNERSATRD